jgi:hypothetical protein
MSNLEVKDGYEEERKAGYYRNLSDDELNKKINEYGFSKKDIEGIYMNDEMSSGEFYLDDDAMLNYFNLVREKRKREH